MEINNPKYKDIGIHIMVSIITVENGITKVLLIKRKNNPYKDMWALVGGALYNDEEVETGLKREIKEKTGLENIDLHFSAIHSKVNRSPIKRMVALSYIGVIDYEKTIIQKDTLKTSNAEWFSITDIPSLAYDHNEIIELNLKTLKEKIETTNILKSLFNNTFTIPELLNVYETILEKKIDRRNFRKKLLNDKLIEDINMTKNYKGNKPAKLYKFK